VEEQLDQLHPLDQQDRRDQLDLLVQQVKLLPFLPLILQIFNWSMDKQLSRSRAICFTTMLCTIINASFPELPLMLFLLILKPSNVLSLSQLTINPEVHQTKATICMSERDLESNQMHSHCTSQHRRPLVLEQCQERTDLFSLEIIFPREHYVSSVGEQHHQLF